MTFFFKSNHWGSHILSSWIVHAGIHPSRTWKSGSFESVQWNACMHRVDLSLYFHLREVLGNGVRTHVNSKGKISSTGSSEEDRTHNTTTQDSEPNTPPAELFPPSSPLQQCLQDICHLHTNSLGFLHLYQFLDVYFSKIFHNYVETSKYCT